VEEAEMAHLEGLGAEDLAELAELQTQAAAEEIAVEMVARELLLSDIQMRSKLHQPQPDLQQFLKLEILLFMCLMILEQLGGISYGLFCKH
jgi:hypothetical protein